MRNNLGYTVSYANKMDLGENDAAGRAVFDGLLFGANTIRRR